MKYLFFDIECANCFKSAGKICEFGYVLTDDAFNILEQKLLIINPNSHFDWFVEKRMLAYPKSAYLNSHDYLHYFTEIKALFTDEDVMVFGHTTDADAKYLNDEAKRYNLEFFNYKFYDAKYMYNTYANLPNGSLGVERLCEVLEIQLPKHSHQHRSVDDAYATMLIVKELCKRMNISVNELIEQCEDCKCETKDGVITTTIREKARLREEAMIKLYGANIKNNLIKKDNQIKLWQFMAGVQPQCKITEHELKDKKVSISKNYTFYHFKETLSLVQLLKNVGSEYVTKATESDIFVTYDLIDEDGNAIECKTLQYVQEAIENNTADIKIITFDELLALLNTDTETLLQMPYPDEKYFIKRPNLENSKSSKSKENKLVYSTGNKQTSTLGDLLAKRGIDLSKLVFDE